MNDCLTNALRKDMNLYRKYARAEAKYILSLGKNFALVDIELDIDDITFNKFIEKLAKEGICLDELVLDYLKKYILNLEKNNEEISKYTKNKENRKNRRCR